jgi:hypothetical protein
MWSCNGSASLAVCPERRVLPIVTLRPAADEVFFGLISDGNGCPQPCPVGAPTRADRLPQEVSV